MRHDLALDNWLAKATQKVTRRVKVLVQALMTGTPSRTLQGADRVQFPVSHTLQGVDGVQITAAQRVRGLKAAAQE